jgi:GMP synthase (glutamine-hydrolysing)
MTAAAAQDREIEKGGAREQTILVLDFGSQFSQLIARRVREANVYCELVPGTTPWSELKKRTPAGLILGGGPASVYEPGAPQVDPEALRASATECS